MNGCVFAEYMYMYLSMLGGLRYGLGLYGNGGDFGVDHGFLCQSHYDYYVVKSVAKLAYGFVPFHRQHLPMSCPHSTNAWIIIYNVHAWRCLAGNQEQQSVATRSTHYCNDNTPCTDTLDNLGLIHAY